jgi:hypothetical protein
MVASKWLILVVFMLGNAWAGNMTCLDKLLPFSKFSGVHQLSKQE